MALLVARVLAKVFDICIGTSIVSIGVMKNKQQLTRQQ